MQFIDVMRFKKWSLLLLLAVSTLRLEAQCGLTIKMPQKPHAVVALSAYKGANVVVIDSLRADSSGCCVYEPALPNGMYFVEGDEVDIEFLSVGKPIVMHVEADEVRFDDSPENVRWNAYLQLRERFHYGDKEPERYQQLIDSLAGDSSDFASQLIRIDANPLLQASDFQNLDAICTNVLTTKMVAYLVASDADFKDGVDHILGLAKGKFKSYAFAIEYLLKGFTALGLSEVTDYLLNFPQLNEGEITQEEGRELEILVEPYQKVRVGAKAPDFGGVTIDGKHYRLYDSGAQHTIVVFWSVDCEYCHDFLRQIRKRLDLKNEYELVTFALADRKEEVADEVKRLRLPGNHFYDEARWEGKAFLNYHVTSTPTVFLLDQHKTIIAKPYDWKELEGVIKNL